jgi:hypothetical protein
MAHHTQAVKAMKVGDTFFLRSKLDGGIEAITLVEVVNANSDIDVEVEPIDVIADDDDFFQ